MISQLILACVWMGHSTSPINFEDCKKRFAYSHGLSIGAMANIRCETLRGQLYKGVCLRGL